MAKSKKLNLDLTEKEAQALLIAANYPFNNMPYCDVVTDVFGKDTELAAEGFKAKHKIWEALIEAENKEMDLEAKMGGKAAVTQ